MTDFFQYVLYSFVITKKKIRYTYSAGTLLSILLLCFAILRGLIYYLSLY